jgi:hypothetical protein
MKKLAIDLFLRGIKGFALFSSSTLLTVSNIRLFKKLITCLVIALFAANVQAQLTIGLGTSLYFNDYHDATNDHNNSNKNSDLAKVRPYKDSGAVWIESDSRYDCHAWAWYKMCTIRLGYYGIWPIDINTDWAEPRAPMVYYGTGGPYMETTEECQASVVIYGQPSGPTHSALRLTSDSRYAGMYESKWADDGPLAVHTLCGNPYYHQSQPIHFYKRPSETNYIEYDPQKYDTIFGPDKICASNATYKVYLPVGAKAVWNWDSSKLDTVSGQNTNSFTVKRKSTAGWGWVEVSFLSKKCLHSSSKSTLRKYVEVAIAYPQSITSISTSQYTPGPGTSTNINVPENSWTHFYAFPFVPNDLNDLTQTNSPDSHGATSYTWTCNPSSYAQNPEPNNARNALIAFNQLYYYTLTVTASNACGSVWYPQSIYVTGYFSLSPNPTSTDVTVTMMKGNNADAGQTFTGIALPDSLVQTTSLQSAPEVQTNVPVTYTVKIVNSFGSLLYSSKKTGDTFTIPVGNLGKGNYLVQISDGKTVSSQILIISR